MCIYIYIYECAPQNNKSNIVLHMCVRNKKNRLIVLVISVGGETPDDRKI